VLLAPSELAMELGETGDALWDAAQRRMRRDGYLHNNVRMTWGKQLVAWCDDPARALRIMESLNHRYAIDGRDPGSYSGLLWCLGQFDRPHPRSDRWGAVRARETRVHARRLPPERYLQTRVGRAPAPTRVLVVGAGLAGVSCARALREHGVPVTVFEKSPSVGGRLARRTLDDRAFSHGAAVLHARTPHFARLCALLADEGLLAPHGDGAFRAKEPMPAAVRRFARELSADVLVNQRVSRVERCAAGWRVVTEDGGEAQGSHVVIAVPCEQAAALVEGVAHASAVARLRSVRYARTLVAMASSERADPGGHAEFVCEDVVGEPSLARWTLSRERSGRASLVAYATEAFSDERWTDDGDERWTDALLALARARAGAEGERARSSKRWRYARVTGAQRAAEGTMAHLALTDDRTLIAAGDGVAHTSHGLDAEAAWASGCSAASSLLGGADR
jgi:predicted NAD/FAD-dependent oxidoreductase